MLFVARGFQRDKSMGSSGKERSQRTCAAGELKKQNQAEFVRITLLFLLLLISLCETVPSASEPSPAIYKRH